MQAVRAGWRRLSRDERLAYLILLPALSAVFVIVTIPFVLVIIQSLSTEDGTFVGPLNYSRALANPLLYEAIRATGVYALIVLPIEILLGLSFALLVHRTVRRPGLRAAIYVLAILPVGYPAYESGRGKKMSKPLRAVADRERYGQPAVRTIMGRAQQTCFRCTQASRLHAAFEFKIQHGHSAIAALFLNHNRVFAD